MTPPPSVKTRRVRETLLVVCEGDAEVAFVRYVRRMYDDSLGRSVQEKNAHGMGGKHVLDTALRIPKSSRSYDKVVLLLDTDTNWDDACRARARKSRIGKHGVSVIESTPCLEAWLLKILGTETEGDTRYMKREFKNLTGYEAHESAWMEQRLSQEVLDQARDSVPELANLMNHMGIAKQ